MIHSNEERQAPTRTEDAEPSHLARYQFALEHLKSTDRALDAPCGSGYGTHVLASRAHRVDGVDIYAPAIEHAQEFFSNGRTSFHVGTIEDMEAFFPGREVFDSIVSFEGIEHVNSPESFLAEVQRMLKISGMFIISTPRKPHGSPYHIREFSLNEFKKTLSERFTVTKMFGQIYTDIFDLDGRRDIDPHSYTHFNFIAVCTPKP